jgi:RNA polymerase sigma-70 factor (ECF subfamily)
VRSFYTNGAGNAHPSLSFRYTAQAGFSFVYFRRTNAPGPWPFKTQEADLAAEPPRQTPPTDLELLHRAQGQDFAAFEELVTRYEKRIYVLAMGLLRQHQDAENVVQETFLALLEHLQDFREEASVSTWILRIATNQALKVLRKRRGLPTVPLEPERSGGESYAALPHPEFIARWRENPEDLAVRAEVRRLLDGALAELDEKYRLVFLLRDVEGLSVRETAEALGLSEANVKVRLLRARLLLRERLTRVLGDEATRLFPAHDHP